MKVDWHASHPVERYLTAVEFLPYLRDWTESSRPMYKGLAAAIEAAIERGDLAPGLRLPSERELADSLGVSRSTVVNAYEELRTSGCVGRRQGSGTYVFKAPLPITHVQDVGTATRRYAGYRGLADHSRQPVDLSMGALPAPTEVGEVIAEIKDGVTSQALYLQSHGYSPAGLEALREQLAAEYTAAKIPTHTGQILVTTGAQQAIFLIAVTCLSAGNPAVIEDLTYPGALDAFSAVGARLLPLPVDADGMDVTSLRSVAARSHAKLLYVGSTFHNPTGVRLSGRRRRVVAAVAGELGLITLDDTALADLALMDSVPLEPIAAADPQGPILTVGSLSKTFWGGLRIGWVRGPERLIEDLARVKGAVDRGTPVLDQIVAANLLPLRAQVATKRRNELAPRLATLTERLRAELPSWSWREPSGGTSLMAQLPAGHAKDLAELAYRHGVIVVPGSVFSATGQHDDRLRLTFVAEPDQLREGVRRLSAAWGDYISRYHIQPPTASAVV